MLTMFHRASQGPFWDGNHTMISHATVYRAASKLIERHGVQTLSEATRVLDKAIDHRDAERLLVWLRIRRAIATLEAPPGRLMH